MACSEGNQPSVFFVRDFENAGLTDVEYPLFFAPEVVHSYVKDEIILGGLFRSLQSALTHERSSGNEDNRWKKRQA
jgi:hypothetical protein